MKPLKNFSSRASEALNILVWSRRIHSLRRSPLEVGVRVIASRWDWDLQG